MRKIGCLIVICALVLICAWKGYVDVFVPHRLAEKAIQATSRYSLKCVKDCSVIPQEEKYNSKNGLLCKRILRNGMRIELCQNPIGDVAYASIDRILKPSQLKIQIHKEKVFSTTFNIDIGKGHTAFLDRSVAYSFSSAYSFFSWIEHSDAPERDLEMLKVIDNVTGKNVIEKEILATTCCLENLAIGYDHKASKLLLSWNDWSRTENKNLFYGILDIGPLLRGDKVLNFRQLEAGDKWDKRNPVFFKDGKKNYLIYATGDRWGWLSYTGKQSIGICMINDNLEPIEFRMVASKLNVGKALKIENGYLYYELLSENENRVLEIRKIRIADTFRTK